MRSLSFLPLALTLWAAPLWAQDGGAPFGAACTAAGGAVGEHCLRVAEAVQIIGPRVAVTLGGANPVPGSPSTLGMRVGRTPRLSIGMRITGTRVELPGVAGPAAPPVEFTPLGLSVDAGVGLFQGLTLGPTVGGFAAVDLLASVGRTGLPGGEGFAGAVTSWAAGARLGIIRESFTAPGVSFSALYRRVGTIELGDPALADAAAWFRLNDQAGISLRGVVGKRLLGLGLSAGGGWDRYHASAAAAVRTGGVPAALAIEDDAWAASRTTLFASADFTLVILHTVAELGWQSGGTTAAAVPDSGRLGESAIYGSLALRLTL